MAQYGSIWLNAVHQASYFMAQYCCIIPPVIWLWFNAVHPCLNAIRNQYGCALCNNMAQCCTSWVKMAQFGSISCIMHPYGSVSSASCIKIMAQSCALHGSIQCIHSSLMCIRHQCGCASCISMARCSASMTRAVHHASIWLNMAQYSTTHHTKPTTS